MTLHILVSSDMSEFISSFMIALIPYYICPFVGKVVCNLGFSPLQNS